MSEGDFRQLLEVMPRIAEAVKDLPDGLQERAFDELINMFKGVPTPRMASAEMLSVARQPAEEGGVSGTEDESYEELSATGGQSRRTKKAGTPRKVTGRRSWSPVRDIDFRPPDKQAFRDLVAEKEPTTNFQKNLLAIYWLEQVYELSEITVGHVVAAYKECNWREMAQADKQLRNTASETQWIDTGSMKAIKTTPRGRNTVEHDMPLPGKVKK
ncbi:hypothetical protein ACI2K4_13330 [Micromonospora sp. NPDC050397]|uniref:hypothetical protein n=1 Tax=Micromonospora sp. NPDC050397 TaxID=3364279 RepID=UPI00384AA023